MKLNAMIGIRVRRIAAPLAAALAAICAATTALPSYADSITVAPVVDANGLETAFNLTLDVSATRYLCAAWAETDQGANYTAWTNDNFEVLGEVNAETTSWSFAAPKGWGAEMRALRFFLVEKETRPYDARVEWIESTGAEWINTGYVGGSEDHLGDFKDDSGSASATLAKLDEIEAAFAAFSGGHYHVMGNHDTDVLTKDEFFAHVSNTGFAAAQGYYSFVRGGVKFIVLDANFNSDSDTDHFSRGNWTCSVAYIPPAERAWLEAELAAATGPVVVFCHQRLDGTGSYFVKNAAEVRRIIEKSCKVIGVFAGHEHAGGRNCMNGVSYYTLRSLAESGKCFEVACYSNGVSVFGRV